MLVIKRKTSESVIIDESAKGRSFKLTILHIRNGIVELGIEFIENSIIQKQTKFVELLGV